MNAALAEAASGAGHDELLSYCLANLRQQEARQGAEALGREARARLRTHRELLAEQMRRAGVTAARVPAPDGSGREAWAVLKPRLKDARKPCAGSVSEALQAVEALRLRELADGGGLLRGVEAFLRAELGKRPTGEFTVHIRAGGKPRAAEAAGDAAPPALGPGSRGAAPAAPATPAIPAAPAVAAAPAAAPAPAPAAAPARTATALAADPAAAADVELAAADVAACARAAASHREQLKRRLAPDVEAVRKAEAAVAGYIDRVDPAGGVAPLEVHVGGQPHRLYVRRRQVRRAPAVTLKVLIPLAVRAVADEVGAAGLPDDHVTDRAAELLRQPEARERIFRAVQAGLDEFRAAGAKTTERISLEKGIPRAARVAARG